MESHRRAVKAHRDKKIKEGYRPVSYLLTPKAAKGLDRRLRKGLAPSGQALINAFLEGPDNA